MRTTSFLAMAVMLAANAVGAAVAPAAIAAPTARPAAAAHVAAAEKTALATTSASRTGSSPVPAGAGAPLGSIEVENRNTNAKERIALYDASGQLDAEAASAFMRVASHAGSDANHVERLDKRLVQLVFRASYHFGGAPVSIVSATRKGARGKHGNGEAIDFALTGVKAWELAAYLRGMPLAGVGIYTHPKTQYVHLDVREQSYHWIDASPPGVSWRERRLPDPKQAARDATYDASMDLPER